MTQQEVIDAIKVLTEVVKANKGWLGSESAARNANDKIQELIPLLNNNQKQRLLHNIGHPWDTLVDS